MSDYRSRKTQPRFAGGFTLIEVLIVVGILVAIIALALPAILKAKNTGIVTRQQADLHTIELALEAYKTDFGDYPRFADQATMAAETAGNAQWLDYATDRGARLLCFALVSPGPVGTAQTANPGEDGADGPGFRARRSANGANGKVYGPYLDAAKFRLEFMNGATYPYADAKLLDGSGNPILYYPAMPGAANVGAGSSYVASVDPSLANPTLSFYNAYDNTMDFTSTKALLSVADMQTILGADSTTNPVGQVDAGKTPVTTIPYLLWTAGADGQFGLDKNRKTDDVCNFDIPSNLKK